MAKKPLIYMTDQDRRHSQETRALLEGRGFEARWFGSGEEAMAAGHERRPDLFITSMGLTGEIDGLQYTRALKADDALKDVPVILLTGVRRVMNLPFKFEPDARWFQIFAVIEKPARPDYLLEVIEEALAQEAVARSE